MIMGIVYWTLMIGFITGAITKFLFHGMKQGEIFTTMTFGVIGSVIGGWLGSTLGLYEYGENTGLIASVIGAVLMSIVYIYYYKKKSHKIIS